MGGGCDPNTLSNLVSKVMSFQTGFCGLDLLTVTSNVWGWYTVVPIIAALSSWVMCFTQNLSNVIQHEQGKINKYGIMGLSVALSLILGIFAYRHRSLLDCKQLAIYRGYVSFERTHKSKKICKL